MSQNGQRGTGPVTASVTGAGSTAMVFGAAGLASGTWFTWHRHGQHQLVWASRGVVNVDIGAAHWVLPPSRALWVPAGTTHRTGTPSGADIRAIFLEPDRCPLTWDAPALLRVTDLLRELFDYLTVAEMDDARRARAEAVVFDLVEPVDVVPLGARLPTDDRAHRVAAAVVADPRDGRTLAEYGTVVGASSRTLARLFVAETGLGFGQWRTQIRLAASLPLLADGMPLTSVSRRVGYATPSAFVAAFRREVGVSPGRYFTN